MMLRPFLTSTMLALALVSLSCGKRATKAPVEEVQVQNLKATQAKNDFRAAIKSNDLAKVKFILNQNPDLKLNHLLEDGNTYLILSIQKNFTAIRDFLLTKGANPEKANNIGETPLMTAVMVRSMNSTMALVDAGVELNQVDNRGEAALHKAIKLQGVANFDYRKSYEDLAAYLVNQGASLTLADRDGKSAYDLILDNPNEPLLELVKKLLSAQKDAPDIITFKKVIQDGDVKNLDIILTKYEDIVKIYESINPLYIAAGIGEEIKAIELCQKLLTGGAKVDGPADVDVTPLIRAIELKRVSLMQALLNANADVNETGKRGGMKPLFHAIKANEPKMVRALLASGADTKSLVKDERDKRKSMNACQYSRQVGRELNLDGRVKYLQIRSALGCGGRWSPRSENRD